jgi:sortase A
MTVRLLLHESPAKPVRRSRRLLEYMLLFVGLIAIDTYIWINVDTMVDQDYGSWSLDQQIDGRHPSFTRYLRERLRIEEPAPAEPIAANPEGVKPPPAPRVAQHLARYTLIGRVEVPRLGLSAVVREGVDSSTLRSAVGHMPSTPLPGQPGNSALAAHRDTLFRKLRGIRKDDRITIQTVDGSYDYIVESLKIVDPSDVGVLKASAGDRLLTLITCYPFNYIGSAPNRFVVRAREVDVTARSQRHPLQTKS